MSDIYCGIEKVPKGKRLGSMFECAEKGQVRYYVLKKIDTKILEHVKNKKKDIVSRDKLIISMIELREKKKILTDKIEYSTDKTKKTLMQKQLKTVTKDLQDVLQKLEMFKKEKLDDEEE